MARRVFYSFHYRQDNWRAAEVRNIGSIEGNSSASDNDWETVKKGGDAAIKKWISGQMRNRTCTVVLVGSKTANRKWINHEIRKSWIDGMGVVGIHIHGLRNSDGYISKKGKNPFDSLEIGGNEIRFDLSGFLVRPAILTADEVKEIREQIYLIKHDPESLPSGTPGRARWTI